MIAQPGMVGLPPAHDECRELREALVVVIGQRNKLLAALKEAAGIVESVTDYDEFPTVRGEWQSLIDGVEI